jgi:hypothetical protein
MQRPAQLPYFPYVLRLGYLLHAGRNVAPTGRLQTDYFTVLYRDLVENSEQVDSDSCARYPSFYGPDQIPLLLQQLGCEC